MCGILCEIIWKGKNVSANEKIIQKICNRGPNYVNTIEVNAGPITFILCGSVLWMQGESLTPQPIQDENGVLLYNGDIFDESWSGNVSDTETLMSKLCNRMAINSEQHVVKVLRTLKGPFSLIYYDRTTEELFFSRDRIGRGTMLFHRNDSSMVISSVLGREYECVEVPATYIYCLNVKELKVKLLSWDDNEESQMFAVDDWLQNLYSIQNLPDDQFSFDFNDNDTLYSDYDNIVDYIENVAKNNNCKKTIMKKLMENEIIMEAVQHLTDLLEKSVKIRLKRQPNLCKNCLEFKYKSCKHCTVGVLFSGGLDCTILAFLADKYLPKEQSIDLINVAFRKDHHSTYEVPDRITGWQSFKELQLKCPHRQWVFKEVNVPTQEVKEFQQTTIADLIYPRKTILDESLGSALWFAARGNDHQSISACRVLLLGSGADELFGGYTRHRNAYKRHGWTGLAKELVLDWKRISFRNLSRDNRVICDHGRQPRLPYLDEDFTKYVLKLKPWLRCFPSESLGPGIGDKLMLRLVAYNFRLTEAVILPKRALQFGSRIANNKEKGSDISKSFLYLDK